MTIPHWLTPGSDLFTNPYQYLSFVEKQVLR